MPSLRLLSRLYLRGSGSAARDLVANMQLFLRTQELHTLKVTGRGWSPKSRLMQPHWRASLQKIKSCLLAGTTLEDEATLSHYWVEALSTQEVANRILGDKVHGSLTNAGKVRGQTLKVVI